MRTFLESKNIVLALLVLLTAFMFSCTQDTSVDAEYSFKVAFNVDKSIEDADDVNFESFSDLNLGFFRGNIWIILEIKNSSNEAKSYMFLSNDRFSRNYMFYELDTIDGIFKRQGSRVDPSKDDYRTFNAPNPNFKIDLASNEEAIYLITSESDGRTKDATPKIVSLETYYDHTNENIISSIIFYSIIIFLLLVNFYLWGIYKAKIYVYYIFYIISTLLVYLGIEGYLFYIKVSVSLIDHFIFVFVKLWVLSLILYTSKFFDLQTTAPKYFSFIKVVLVVVLGGTFIYQLIFYNSSIQYLHYFENLLIPIWLALIVGILLLSAKQRWLELKYYLIPFAFFIFFTIFGVLNVHLQLLAGNSFTYVKIGAIFEFVGFTYFVTALIKRKINRADKLEQDLKEKEELLSKKIEPSDLVSVFSLIENSLSTDTEWKEFQNKLEEINPSFLNNLLKEHSNLSKSEIRLITLINLGYSQKEIASILNIAPDSVKKARTRVRKKLELSEEEKLKDYLSKF